MAGHDDARPDRRHAGRSRSGCDPTNHALGWDRPGVTTSAYVPPFETWASMAQTLWAEDWPDDDRPGTVAYFCGSARGTLADDRGSDDDYVCRLPRTQVHAEAVKYLDRHIGLYLPGAVDRGRASTGIC